MVTNMSKAIVICTLICIFLINFCCCADDSCKNNAGIKVSELLELYASSHSITYCNLLEKAINKDTLALNSFLRLEIMDGAGYDHGEVLMELFLYLGEDFIISTTSGLSRKEITRVKNYIKVGIEYTKLGYEKDFSRLFPNLYQIWDEI